MTFAIGTYVEMNQTHRFQNFHVGETRKYKGEKYLFAGFGYGGSTTDLQAGNLDSQLVFNLNEISLSLAKQAVTEGWLVIVRTVWLNPETLKEQANYMVDYFTAVQFQHDTLRLTLDLSSPLDAVTAEVPRRRLTQEMVGAMPGSGDIPLL